MDIGMANTLFKNRLHCTTLPGLMKTTLPKTQKASKTLSRWSYQMLLPFRTDWRDIQYHKDIHRPLLIRYSVAINVGLTHLVFPTLSGIKEILGWFSNFLQKMFQINLKKYSSCSKNHWTYFMWLHKCAFKILKYME